MPQINRKFNNIKPVQYNHEGNQSSKFYNSIHWKKLRNQFIMQHPLCYDCALEGRSVPAEEIHHKIPFLTGKDDDEKWNLLLDPKNLVSLCIKHHRERHKIHTDIL